MTNISNFVNEEDPLLKALVKGQVKTQDLAEKCPTFIDFHPTSEALSKLFRRMLSMTEDNVLAYEW